MKKLLLFLCLLAPAVSDAQGVFAELVMRNPKVKIKNKHDIYLHSITVDGKSDIFATIHHHGVAFESDLVGYRIYFDKRQTIDLYGKFKRRLELKDTQFYTDSVQKSQGYGDDVLWVGNSFGCGALRGWDGKRPSMVDNVASRTQRIVWPGPDSVVVEVVDEKWRQSPSSVPVTLTERYTLKEGHRDVRIDCFFEPCGDGKGLMADTTAFYSTGIVNVKGSTGLNDHQGLRGCWGTDWPAGATDTVGKKRETVGLGIYVPQKYIVDEWTDDTNYGYVVRPDGHRLTYYVTFCSDNEEESGFHSREAWFDHLRQWAGSLR